MRNNYKRASSLDELWSGVDQEDTSPLIQALPFGSTYLGYQRGARSNRGGEGALRAIAGSSFAAGLGRGVGAVPGLLLNSPNGAELGQSLGGHLGNIVGGHLATRGLVAPPEGHDVEAAIREDAINATLAHYKVAGLWSSGVRAVGTVGRALGVGGGVRGGVNALSAGAMSRGLGNGLFTNLGHAAQGFHQAGGTKALGQLAGGAAALGGAAYLGGSAFGAGQQQQRQQGYPRYV